MIYIWNTDHRFFRAGTRRRGSATDQQRGANPLCDNQVCRSRRLPMLAYGHRAMFGSTYRLAVQASYERHVRWRKKASMFVGRKGNWLLARPMLSRTLTPEASCRLTFQSCSRHAHPAIRVLAELRHAPSAMGWSRCLFLLSKRSHTGGGRLASPHSLLGSIAP